MSFEIYKYAIICFSKYIDIYYEYCCDLDYIFSFQRAINHELITMTEYNQLIWSGKIFYC